MQPWRRRFLLFYMMRVPLTLLTTLGLGLPWLFGTAMFHGVADLVLLQLGEAAFLGFLLISSSITTCFLVLLYGEERVDGWADRPPPQVRISLWTVGVLYLYGAICYVSFLISICKFMSTAGRLQGNPSGGCFVYSLAGMVAGILVVTLYFLAVLRFAKPEDDDALEVFAFPAFLIFRKFFGGAWIRAFKQGTRSRSASGTFAAHNGWLSRKLASLLGPGYGTPPSPQRPSVLNSGFRSTTFVLLVFLVAYWLSGEGTLRELRNVNAWGTGLAPNSVLNYLLLVLIFWGCLLAALTFFVDRFRLPAVVVLAVVLIFIAFLGTSDHRFLTVPIRPDAVLLTPEQALKNAPDEVIVVAASGGGIQSAAWTSRVLCGLRADPALPSFEKSVLAISGVSGGSVGAMFYLRCLESPANDQEPATWAQDSSLEAVAWGLTHPDLRRIFIPGPATHWSGADRGWALERSLVKSARFDQSSRQLTDPHASPRWPIVLLNSTDALTGDPVVFTNSQFPNDNASETSHHYLRNFHQTDPGRDVLLETAARMSASFPYVSPESRPDSSTTCVHLGDGGYFDNSGVFALSEWLKEAVRSGHGKKILFLQLDAFPDTESLDQEGAKKWYYQLTSPINTMLEVRSEGQVVRDRVAGEDLKKLLQGSGFETTWLPVRYAPPQANAKGAACPASPPLSWHLTPTEQRCIDEAWTAKQKDLSPQIACFLKGFASASPDGECEERYGLKASAVEEQGYSPQSAAAGAR
jgi:hypothetical protein